MNALGFGKHRCLKGQVVLGKSIQRFKGVIKRLHADEAKPRPRLSRCFLFSLGISTLRCISCYTTAIRLVWYHFVYLTYQACLPCIHSTTWLELHLLTGSIINAMVEVCLYASQKKNTPNNSTLRVTVKWMKIQQKKKTKQIKQNKRRLWILLCWRFTDKQM